MHDSLTQRTAELAEAYSQFWAATQRLSPAQRGEPGVCGYWSPHAVVAHLVGWDHALCSYITDPDHFEPPADVDQFNRNSVARYQSTPWGDLLQTLQIGFADLEQALAAVAPDQKNYARVLAWTTGRGNDYALHTRQLTSWLSG